MDGFEEYLNGIGIKKANNKIMMKDYNCIYALKINDSRESDKFDMYISGYRLVIKLLEKNKN
jgi:hypothetical protein